MSTHNRIGQVGDCIVSTHEATGDYGRTGVELSCRFDEPTLLTSLQCRTLAALLIVAADHIDRTAQPFHDPRVR